jgi:CHRD domain
MRRFWAIVHAVTLFVVAPGWSLAEQGGALFGQARPVSAEQPRYLVADLSGQDEVSPAGHRGAGAPGGGGQAILRLQGDRITFQLRWHGIGAPTMGHVHAGAAGTAGPVAVALFEGTLPDGVTAASGGVPVPDRATRDRLRADPGAFYVNLHTAKFPSGAIRGQLRPLGAGPLTRWTTDRLPLDQPVDRSSLDRLLTRPAPPAGRLVARLSGAAEVPTPGGPAVGDPDARAAAFLRLAGTRVDYTLAWTGLTPTMGHVHAGARGVNGPVVVALFGTPLPPSLTGVAGSVTGLDAAVLARIARSPSAYYVNLHSQQFPGGAARGQLCALRLLPAPGAGGRRG